MTPERAINDDKSKNSHLRQEAKRCSRGKL
jgi:hypothetical protein